MFQLALANKNIQVRYKFWNSDGIGKKLLLPFGQVIHKYKVVFIKITLLKTLLFVSKRN